MKHICVYIYKYTYPSMSYALLLKFMEVEFRTRGSSGDGKWAGSLPQGSHTTQIKHGGLAAS